MWLKRRADKSFRTLELGNECSELAIDVGAIGYDEEHSLLIAAALEEIGQMGNGFALLHIFE